MNSLKPWLMPSFNRLVMQIQQNKIAHALLIAGSKGLAVSELAEALVAFRLCDKSDQITAASTEVSHCGECRQCELVGAGTHPDFLELAPEGPSQLIKIDSVRKTVDFINQTPQLANWKVVLIRSADKMNTSSANAILKVLEEPPGQSLFILETENPGLLLATIRSRCQFERVQNPDVQTCYDYLRRREIDLQKIQKLRDYAVISAPDALLLENKDDQANLNKLVSALYDEHSVIASAEQLASLDLTFFIDWFLRCILNSFRNAMLQPGISEVALNALLKVYDSLLDARSMISSGTNFNKHLLIETLLMDWRSAQRHGYPA